MCVLLINLSNIIANFEQLTNDVSFAYFKAPVLQILLENHELCKYAKISLHIHIIVDLNKNIGLNPHMFTVLLRKQTIRVSAIGMYLL